MTPMRGGILLAMMVLFFGGLAVAEESGSAPASGGGANIAIQTEVDRDNVTIGDIITYTIEITYDPALELERPPMGANLGNFVIRDFDTEEVDLEDGRRRLTQTFKLATYFLEEREIPPYTVEYTTPDGETGSVSSPRLTVMVNSVAADADEGLRPPRPPRDIAPDYTRLYTIIAGSVAGLVVLVALIVWLIRRRKPPEEAAAPPRPDWEVALEQFAAIERATPETPEEWKALYFRFSEMVRLYLDGVFGCHLMERTVDEIRHELREVPLPEGQYPLIMGLLNDFDLIKFAGVTPSMDEFTGHLDQVRTLLREVPPPTDDDDHDDDTPSAPAPPTADQEAQLVKEGA